MTVHVTNLTTIPDACYAYTEIFQTFRIEHAILATVFLLIGVLIGKYGN